MVNGNKILNKLGKEKFCKWLKKHGSKFKINLEYANLKGAYLKGVNLRWANLEYAYLKGANLEYANLEVKL